MLLESVNIPLSNATSRVRQSQVSNDPFGCSPTKMLLFWHFRYYGSVKNPGALPLKGGTGMCRGHDHLFSGQSTLPSLPIYHQCAAHVPIF